MKYRKHRLIKFERIGKFGTYRSKKNSYHLTFLVVYFGIFKRKRVVPLLVDPKNRATHEIEMRKMIAAKKWL